MINIKKILCLLFLWIMIASNIIAQETGIVKTVFSDKSLGGDCVIKNARLYVDGETTMNTFEIEVPAEGAYYLAAWIMNTAITERNNGLNFFIDDEKSPAGKLIPQKESWQSTKLNNNTNTDTEKIKLSAGKHLFTFCSTVPEFPSVEFIKLVKNESDAVIPEDNWTSYFETAKRNTSTSEKDSLEDSNLSKVTEENPTYDYDYMLNAYFTYTYFTDLYLNIGTVVLETKKSDPYASDPVMYLFNLQNPANGSWGDDDGGHKGGQSKITALIQSAGYYRVLVRSYYSNQSQTTNLYLNNNLYASNIVISGATLVSDHNITQQINYFTTFPTGDPMLWIQRNDLTIQGNNDDYIGSGDVVWQQNARVKKAYSLTSGQRMNRCIVTSASTYYPTGYCDVYMRCKNSTITWGGRVKADDAIKSGNST